MRCELIGVVTFRTCAVRDCEDSVRAARRSAARRQLAPGLSAALRAQSLLGLELCATAPTVVYILTLGTDDAFRRRGIAGALLQRVLTECQARACGARRVLVSREC